MDTEELKCRDLFNIGSTNRDWARNAVMDLHLPEFKCILLLTAKASISSTTTFNKDGELRGTTSKTVRSSTNLMRAPQLWTRSLTITANNTGPNFVPWGMPPFRYKGAETEGQTRVTWVLPCKKDATHLSKLQWRLYCVESFSINIRWSIRSKTFLKSEKNNLLDSNRPCPGAVLKPSKARRSDEGLLGRFISYRELVSIEVSYSRWIYSS